MRHMLQAYRGNCNWSRPSESRLAQPTETPTDKRRSTSGIMFCPLYDVGSGGPIGGLRHYYVDINEGGHPQGRGGNVSFGTLASPFLCVNPHERGGREGVECHVKKKKKGNSVLFAFRGPLTFPPPRAPSFLFPQFIRTFCEPREGVF